MKYVRVIGAILLTMVMLYIARRNSVGAPEHFVQTVGQYQFEIETVPKGIENGDTTIRVNVTGPLDNGQRVVVQLISGSEDNATPAVNAAPMTQLSPASSEYCLKMPMGARGDKVHYYIAVTDAAGADLAKFGRPDGSPFALRSIGHVPKLVLIFHIAFIFATFFCVSMGALSALPLIAGETNVRGMAIWFLGATICAFVGGYPFGFAMNHFAFGGLWEGVPFGTDATDNKTQILLIYVLFVTIAAIGSLTKGKIGRDVFAPRTLGWLGVIGFLLQMSIYLVPHSIQYSASLTYSVCYGYTAAIVLIYIVGWLTSRSKAPVPLTR